MQYVRQADLGALEAATGRHTDRLLDRASGARTLALNLIKTPSGEGSPEGRHTHAFDQIFYIVSGVMSLEIDGERVEAKPGSLVFIPEGLPHRNWNSGSSPSVHIAIASPLPADGVPFAQRVAS